MNALTLATTARPTPDEPLPTLAGTHGLQLLRSAPAYRLAQRPEERQALTETAQAVCASLTPAEPEEIALSIESLALHYPAFNRSSAENVVANGHWLEDLEGWPADIIAEACRQWRNSAERFFPTSGQLKAYAQDILDHRLALGRRAKEFLMLCEEEDSE